MYFPLSLAHCLTTLPLVIITVFTVCSDCPKHNSFSSSSGHSECGVWVCGSAGQRCTSSAQGDNAAAQSDVSVYTGVASVLPSVSALYPWLVSTTKTTVSFQIEWVEIRNFLWWEWWDWNRLPSDVVGARSSEVFKVRLGTALSSLIYWKTSVPMAGQVD